MPRKIPARITTLIFCWKLPSIVTPGTSKIAKYIAKHPAAMLIRKRFIVMVYVIIFSKFSQDSALKLSQQYDNFILGLVSTLGKRTSWATYFSEIGSLGKTRIPKSETRKNTKFPMVKCFYY